MRLAATRRLAYEASSTGLLSPDLAAGIRRVKGARQNRDTDIVEEGDRVENVVPIEGISLATFSKMLIASPPSMC